MDKSVLLFVGVLLAGCASTSGDPHKLFELTPTLSQAQQAQQNPAMLKCGSRKAPLCRVASGGRIRKTYKNCTCGALR